MNQEEADEDVVDEVSEEVDSRGEAMHRVVDKRIRGYFQRYALYKSTFYLLTYILTSVNIA